MVALRWHHCLAIVVLVSLMLVLMLAAVIPLMDRFMSRSIRARREEQNKQNALRKRIEDLQQRLRATPVPATTAATPETQDPGNVVRKDVDLQPPPSSPEAAEDVEPGKVTFAPPSTPVPTSAPPPPRTRPPASPAIIFPAEMEKRVRKQFAEADPMCDPKWWERNRDTIGADVPRARCWKEVHAGESLEDESTLVRDPAFRYPCSANFDFPIMQRPVQNRLAFRSIDVRNVLLFHNISAGTSFCNLAYSFDNVFFSYSFNRWPNQRFHSEVEGCCAALDAVSASQSTWGEYLPLPTDFHQESFEHERGTENFAKRRSRIVEILEMASNSSKNIFFYSKSPSPAAELFSNFWGLHASSSSGPAAPINASSSSVSSKIGNGTAMTTMTATTAEPTPANLDSGKKQQPKRHRFLFRSQQEFDSIYGNVPMVDYLPLPGGPDTAFAHVMIVDLLAHPPLAIAMLLSQIARFFSSGVNSAHRNVTVVMHDPAHGQKKVGNVIESLLRIFPVPVLYVQRNPLFPSRRERDIFTPKMSWTPRGTIDVGDECFLDAIPNYLVPALIARVQFALKNGRLPPAETTTTTTTTTAAASTTTNTTSKLAAAVVATESNDATTRQREGDVQNNAAFAEEPPRIAPGGSPAALPSTRSPASDVQATSSGYQYLFPGEYERVGRKERGGYLLRRPIPPELERPWWPDAPVGGSTSLYYDELMRDPPENIALLKTGVLANSGSRGVFPITRHALEVLRRLNYTVLPDILPIDVRMYLINKARRLIVSWGGGATAVQGLFAGNVPAAKSTKNRYNDYSKENPRNRTLDVIMFLPGAYSKLPEWLHWTAIPLHRNHKKVNVTNPATNVSTLELVSQVRTKLQSGLTVELCPPGRDGFAECAFSSPHTWVKLVRLNSLNALLDEHLVISDREKDLEKLGGWCEDRVVDPLDTERARRERWAKNKYRFDAKEYL